MLDFLRKNPPKILVIGDVIIDKYIWCACERISPEAPVPVVLSKDKEQRLGGAANVYANLCALKAKVSILSVVGDDENLSFLKERLHGKLVVKKGYKTPLKSRIIASNQQILRLDDEEKLVLDDESEIKKLFKESLSEFDAFILSDYDKGLLSPSLCKYMINEASKMDKIILVDPKGKDYTKYKGATLLTPNKKEAQAAGFLGDDLESSLLKMQKDLALKYSLITLSEKGIAAYDNKLHLIPAKAREVYDVTGAGDSVIAMLAYALALKVPINRACELANRAAAVVVSRIGSAQASLEDIENHEKKEKLPSFSEKIKKASDLAFLKVNEYKMVFTNGCFDILHFGHLSYLQKARALGDILVVGLNSDASVKRLKGETRPINKESHRAAMLASLFFVDYVVIFDEDTPYELIKALRPDVLVKGADYEKEKVIGVDLVKQTVLIDLEKGLSSSAIIRKIHDIK